MIVNVECPRCKAEFETEMLQKPLACPFCNLRVLHWDEMFQDAIPTPVFESQQREKIYEIFLADPYIKDINNKILFIHEKRMPLVLLTQEMADLGAIPDNKAEEQLNNLRKELREYIAKAYPSVWLA